MQYIERIVCIGVTERKGNIRMDIYWERAGDMEKKTVRYRKPPCVTRPCPACWAGALEGRNVSRAE